MTKIVTFFALALAAIGIFLLTTGRINLSTSSPEYEAKVKERLKDPGSAMFQNVGEYRYEKYFSQMTAWCGEVNSKNGFGGYVGWEPFIVRKAPDINGELDQTSWLVFIGPGTTSVYSKICHN